MKIRRPVQVHEEEKEQEEEANLWFYVAQTPSG